MRNSSWGKNIKVAVISNLNETEAPANLRQLGIVGYYIKANLAFDQIDKLVTEALQPASSSDIAPQQND